MYVFLTFHSTILVIHISNLINLFDVHMMLYLDVGRLMLTSFFVYWKYLISECISLVVFIRDRLYQGLSVREVSLGRVFGGVSCTEGLAYGRFFWNLNFLYYKLLTLFNREYKTNKLKIKINKIKNENKNNKKYKERYGKNL